MINTNVYVGSALMIVFGLLIPICTAVWWIKTRKGKVTTVLFGAATWFVFAAILESVPKAILFNPANPVGKAVMESAVLYTLLGTLIAGLFEETGRFIVFKTLLRRQTNRETGVSHGIGHGGCEAIFTLAVSGIQNLAFAVLIGSGQFEKLIAQTADKGVDVSALEALPQQLAAVTPGTACLSAAERVFAMLLHVGLSILVFYAVKKAKPQLYILAIILHALFDLPAALSQIGVIRSLYVVEAVLAVYAVIFLAVTCAALYRRDTAPQNDNDAMQPLSVYDSPRIEPGSMRMIAHQGYSAVAPGNTLPAYRAAGEAGFWGAECDISRTTDGVWILMHNDTVNATTDGTGSVNDMSYADICALTVDAGANIERYPNLKVPTLTEYLDVCAAYGMHPVIEVKERVADDEIDDLAALLSARAERDRFVLITFRRALAMRCRALLPDMPVYLLVNERATQDDIDFCVQNGLDGLDLRCRLSDEYVRSAQRAGLRIIVWTVDTLPGAERFYDLGVRDVTSNALTPIIIKE